MQFLYGLAADAIAIIHFAYVAVVVGGLLAVWIGALCGWRWVRNLWFRVIHLAMIGIVVAQALLGITCPLTRLEQALRQRAGEGTYEGSFIANWARELLFYDFDQSVFITLYLVFGIAVLATLSFVPPHRRGRMKVEG